MYNLTNSREKLFQVTWIKSMLTVSLLSFLLLFLSGGYHLFIHFLYLLFSYFFSVWCCVVLNLWATETKYTERFGNFIERLLHTVQNDSLMLIHCDTFALFWSIVSFFSLVFETVAYNICFIWRYSKNYYCYSKIWLNLLIFL